MVAVLGFGTVRHGMFIPLERLEQLVLPDHREILVPLVLKASKETLETPVQLGLRETLVLQVPLVTM
jgi:hypothetical protein